MRLSGLPNHCKMNKEQRDNLDARILNALRQYNCAVDFQTVEMMLYRQVKDLYFTESEIRCSIDRLCKRNLADKTLIVRGWYKYYIYSHNPSGLSDIKDIQ
jgi:hypothetical protein